MAMAKKLSRSQSDDTTAPGAPEKRGAKGRSSRELGADVSNRETDTVKLNSLADGPESISGLDAADDRVQQSPGDALAAYEGRSSDLREPTEQDIRNRAYQMYLDRGAHDGQDFDDWLRAEDELRRR
jgi:hypothetical protein